MRIGMVAQLRENVEDAVPAAMDAAARVLEGLGARMVEVVWPELPSTRGITAERAAVHRAAYEADTEQYGADVRASIDRAMEVRAVDNLSMLAEVREIRARSGELFMAVDGERVDVLTGPTMASPARRLDEKENATGSLLRLTGPSNAAGVPVISVPCGFTSGGLPVGL